MPSKRRLRHASSTNAPQALLNNTKLLAASTVASMKSSSAAQSPAANSTTSIPSPFPFLTSSGKLSNRFGEEAAAAASAVASGGGSSGGGGSLARLNHQQFGTNNNSFQFDSSPSLSPLTPSGNFSNSPRFGSIQQARGCNLLNGSASNSQTGNNRNLGSFLTASSSSSSSSLAASNSTISKSAYGGGGGSTTTNTRCSGGGTENLTEKQLRNAHLATLTKEQLKSECRKRGQKVTGNRAELLQRLGVKMSQLQKTESSDHCINKGYGSTVQKSNNNSTTKQSAPKLSPNGTGPSFVRKQSTKDKEREREEREKIVLWRRPTQTIKYCLMECAILTQVYGKKLLEHRGVITSLLVLLALLGVFYKVPGRHQLIIDVIRDNTWFVVYWIGLGVLSSVGLGTGLHTFILYLGPHIASVTLAAYECNALNFPKPPYPDDIICPEESDTNIPPNIWNIMAKVRLEAFLWGAGTALGELPPYFMARAARLSGYDPDDAEDLQKYEELNKKKDSGNLNILDRAKLAMEKLVERVGFLGILACASIPNPLFDLAGITCGHFLVPFWTFFGATLIGKAIIKMHIQKIFVIIAFNESLIEKAVDVLALVPVFGRRLQEPFKSFLENQKTRLHRQRNIPPSESGNMLAKVFEKFVIAMICYFVISIVNSLAQGYHKRIHKKGGKVLRKLAKD